MDSGGIPDATRGNRTPAYVGEIKELDTKRNRAIRELPPNVAPLPRRVVFAQ